MAAKRKVQDSDVQKLRELLSGTGAQILTTTDEGYSTSILTWSRAAEKPAGVAIVPTTAEEISTVVKYAAENNLELAVKGGGHSTAGASSTDGGLLIDLKGLRKVRVDPDKQLLYVQGGCLWSDVDDAAWEHGLATVGGTVADTGVGGLTLGGGYGHLTGKYGLVIDNLVSVTVVLANGEIKKASNEENTDLFWALSGAGQNFGVTTEVVLKAYPQGDALAGVMVFPPTPDVIKRLVEACNDLYQVQDTPEGPQTKAKGRCASLLTLAKPPPLGGQTAILLIFSCTVSEAEGREILKPFEAIGPLDNSIASHPWPKINKLLPVPIGMRSSLKGAACVLPLRAEFITSIMAKYDEFLSGLPDAAGSMIGFEYYDAVKMAELSAGSFANRGHHLNGLVMPLWSKQENDQVCRQWARDMSNMFKKEIEAHGEQPGKGVDGGVGLRGKKGAVMLYGNYDQYDEKSKDIFGDNYERLQLLKKRYDPTNMFNKLFPITPA